VDEQPTLPEEVRSSLPPLAQAYIVFLENQVALFGGQVTALQATVAKLQDQMADLQARAHQNSGNSSRPPSSDPPGPRPHLKHKPSGRQQGVQAGHPGHTRIQLTAEQITARVEHRPAQCSGCTLPLDATVPSEGEPIRVQVWEIPLIARRSSSIAGIGCAAPTAPPSCLTRTCRAERSVPV
jgi:transposase